MIQKCIEMMTKKGSTKIVSFMTPRVGVLILRFGYRSQIVKLHYFLRNFFSEYAKA